LVTQVINTKTKCVDLNNTIPPPDFYESYRQSNSNRNSNLSGEEEELDEDQLMEIKIWKRKEHERKAKFAACK